MDPLASFAGRAPPGLPLNTVTLTDVLPHAASASWWSGNALAVVDVDGRMGIAALPGCANLLGTSLQTFVPGKWQAHAIQLTLSFVP